MKKIISILLICASLLTLFSCGTKYEPQASTEEESRVIMTLSSDNKSYDVKYELYRAFFLTYKKEIEGDNPDVWASQDKEEYINKINEKIIDIITEIYSAFALCDKIGVNIFSSSYDKDIDNYIDIGVKNIKLNVLIEEDRELSDDECYAIYLSNLRENYLTYEAHVLLYRYELALAEIEEYYLGTFDPDSPNPYDKEGELEYTKDDVESYYNGDGSARIIEAFISKDASNAQERINNLKLAMEEKASSGKINEMVSLIVGNSMASESDIKDGMMLGKYELDRLYYEDYTNAAFTLADGEVSEVIEVENEGYYVLYKYEKSADYLSSNYRDIEYSYCKNEVARIRAQIRSELLSSASMTDIYSTISHKDIKM